MPAQYSSWLRDLSITGIKVLSVERCQLFPNSPEVILPIPYPDTDWEMGRSHRDGAKLGSR